MYERGFAILLKMYISVFQKKKKKKKKKKKTGLVGPVVQQIKFGMAQAIQNKNTVLLADQRKR